MSLSTHTCAGLPAEPFVFPAYVCPTKWTKSHYLQASKLPCLPVQVGTAPAGAWVVLQSIPSTANGITIDANTVIRTSVLLSGVHPVETALGAPVTHYRVSLYDWLCDSPSHTPPSTPEWFTRRAATDCLTNSAAEAPLGWGGGTANKAKQI